MNAHSSNKKIFVAATVLSALTLSSLQPSFAGQFRQNHPRRAETLGRDRNINNRINQDRGQLGGHYNQLERQDQSIRRQEQRDARINGGYITPGQQKQLNREENHVNREIRTDYTGNAGGGGGGGWGNGGQNFAQNHPRRAQVLSQDQGLNSTISQDKGNLGGNYGNLERSDRSIARQEQRDARMNGGYITQGQQQQLDNREANLQNRLNKDYNPQATPQ